MQTQNVLQTLRLPARLTAEQAGTLLGSLTTAHRRFLSSILECEPEWDLIQFAHLKDMPALRWKMQNLTKLKSANPKKFQQ